jgi:hypothetical protein
MVKSLRTTYQPGNFYSLRPLTSPCDPATFSRGRCRWLPRNPPGIRCLRTLFWHVKCRWVNLEGLIYCIHIYISIDIYVYITVYINNIYIHVNIRISCWCLCWWWPIMAPLKSWKLLYDGLSFSLINNLLRHCHCQSDSSISNDINQCCTGLLYQRRHEQDNLKQFCLQSRPSKYQQKWGYSMVFYPIIVVLLLSFTVYKWSILLLWDLSHHRLHQARSGQKEGGIGDLENTPRKHSS